MIKKTKTKIDLKRLKKWYLEIQEQPEYGSWRDENGSIYLQKGSEYFGWSVLKHPDNRPRVNGPVLRKRYPGIFNTDFKEKGSIFYGYCEEILNQFPMAFRASLIGLYPGFKYLPHTDYPENSFRMHIAIETNSNCQFQIEDQLIHIPADSYIYIIKTNLVHSAWNFGDTPRVHLTWQMPLTKSFKAYF